MIIGDGIVLGAGGATASIFVTGLSETDTVTASKDGKTVIGKWTQIPNPAYVVPDGYTQLEYIDSTGTQYVDTGVLPNQNTNVELDCAYTGAASTTWYPLFGVHDANNQYYFSFVNTNSNGYSFGFSTQEYYPIGTYSSARRTLAIQNGSLVIDGAIVKTANPAMFAAVNSMYLFALNRNGTVDSRITSMRCYSFKVEKDGSLVRHFIPSKRNSDGANGMYDLVTNAFFANVGTGAFTAGAEIPQTIDGFLIDKIKSYGTWTVTATDGINTATQDVLVDAADVFSVSINYIPSNVLYWNGDQCENVTGGWTNDDYTFTTWGSSYTRFQVTQTDEYMDSSATKGYTLAGTFNAIDLTNYSKVMWEIDNVTGIAGGGYPPTWRLCASPAKSFSTSTETATEVQVTATGTHTYSIDVSSLSGLYFISFTNNSIAYSGRQLIGHILRVWLE